MQCTSSRPFYNHYIVPSTTIIHGFNFRGCPSSPRKLRKFSPANISTHTVLFTFRLQVCNAFPIYIYVICVLCVTVTMKLYYNLYCVWLRGSGVGSGFTRMWNMSICTFMASTEVQISPIYFFAYLNKCSLKFGDCTFFR